MKIQFAATLKDRHGKEITEPNIAAVEIGKPPQQKPITLADICCASLDAVYQDEMQEGLKPKIRRMELIEKITEAEKTLLPLELLDVDRDMIKERIAKRGYSVTWTVAAARLLDADVGAPSETPQEESARQ
jgi:hypothetical protein